MRVLDLCAGKGGLSAAFRARGHDVRTLDYDPAFGCTYTMDVREFAMGSILGCPECDWWAGQATPSACPVHDPTNFNLGGAE